MTVNDVFESYILKEAGLEMPDLMIKKNRQGKKAPHTTPTSPKEPTAVKKQLPQIDPKRFKPSPALDALKESFLNCHQCPLHKDINNYVFGEGNPHADILFIGEAPGRDEDLSGRPFVGRAGTLLTRIIQAMKLRREDVYIANVIKCRPPQNRPPTPDEVAACIPYLEKQIEIIQPKVIILLGATAANHVLKQKVAISKARGNWFNFNTLSGKRIDVMPTYHPAALLRNPNLKKNVWEDMKKVLSHLGKEI